MRKSCVSFSFHRTYSLYLVVSIRSYGYGGFRGIELISHWPDHFNGQVHWYWLVLELILDEQWACLNNFKYLGYLDTMFKHFQCIHIYCTIRTCSTWSTYSIYIYIQRVYIYIYKPYIYMLNIMTTLSHNSWLHFIELDLCQEHSGSHKALTSGGPCGPWCWMELCQVNFKSTHSVWVWCPSQFYRHACFTSILMACE